MGVARSGLWAPDDTLIWRKRVGVAEQSMVFRVFVDRKPLKECEGWR